MSRARPVFDSVKELEYTLAKQKAVLTEFPDAKVHYYLGFTSKQVNQVYTKFDFEKHYNGLYVLPFCEIKFDWNGKEEIIKVHSVPRANRLVYLSYRRRDDNKRIMKFSRMAINMKNNAFRDDLLNACRAEIMNFIKANPGHHLDDKHLEPRLKKLLIFT